MGKSTTKGSFSIAMLNYQGVKINKKRVDHRKNRPSAPHDGCPRDPYLHRSTPASNDPRHVELTTRGENRERPPQKRVKPRDNGGWSTKIHRKK